MTACIRPNINTTAYKTYDGFAETAPQARSFVNGEGMRVTIVPLLNYYYVITDENGIITKWQLDKQGLLNRFGIEL